MPAADDLLVASQAETDHPHQLAGDPVENAESAVGHDEAWLLWLSELLQGTHGLALVCITETAPGNVSAAVSARTPATLEIPDAGLALARRAVLRGSRQRLQLPDNGDVLLGLPLPGSEESSSESTVLLLINGALTRQQQGSLLGLASWALKSARWRGQVVQPAESRFSAVDGDLPESLSITQLIDLLGNHYPGSVCALHWMRADRQGRRRSRVMAVSGQTNIDRSAIAVRDLASHADRRYAEGSAQPLYQSRMAAASKPLSDTRSSAESDWTSSLMIPVSVDGELLVVSLQWQDETRLSASERSILQASLAPLVQSAWLQWRCQQNLPALLWHRCRRSLDARLQRGLKTGLQVGAAVIVLLLMLWPVDKRLSADVMVEAAERHALIAPLDGYVKSVQARAGDRVAKGDLLARLDDEDLLRQADKWAAEAQKNQQDHLSALASHDRVELSSLRESRVLIQAELDQVRAQLARHELRAPVAGIVLSDAVEDALGSAVKAGKILFEVGSAEHYRLALQVPERRISEVEPGQLLSLRMAADPKQRRQARVDTLIPVANASQGENTFKVYATPLESDAGLRPGMKGIGKILVGRESRLAQWWGSLWTRCVWLAWKLGLVA
ncbi:efflux RND transporter periplasmic adaptor subunit [Granulosicoccus sp. 3-233]|uniref:efflux RND transporter periplasmic adaptor subunit n=1 Tax=Granulosicoccus sp. 3-233 TaxID=3417969 RepID=UPI003D348333